MSRHIRTVGTDQLRLAQPEALKTQPAPSSREAAGRGGASGDGDGEPGAKMVALESKWARLQQVEQNAFMTPRERQKFVKDLQGLCRGYRDVNGELLDSVADLQARLTMMEAREKTLRAELKAQHKVTSMYEQFSFVPVSLSADKLQGDVEAIENDIRVNELVTDEPQNLMAPSLPADDNGRKWMLMELKFERLEQLIVVLKKKLLRFEANEHLARVVEEYGDLPHIIRDNNRLKQENTKLRSREQRFACDPLLNRYFGESDETFLRVLTMALQNELAAHRALVAKHNLAANPSLALLVRPPTELPDPTTLADLDTWLQDPLLRNDFGDELKAWREANIGGSPPSQVSPANALALLQELNRVKETNDLLTAQVARLEDERRLSANVGLMREYCDAEFAHPLKGLAKKQFQDINEKLLAELKSVNSQFAQAEATLAMQSGILATMSSEKQTLMEENVIIGKRVLALLNQNKELHKRMEKTSQLCHSLYLANLSTIQGVLASKLPESQIETFVHFFHRDILLTYLTMYNAAVRIQSWYRGVKVRVFLARRYAFVARACLRFKRRPVRRPQLPELSSSVASLDSDQMMPSASAVSGGSNHVTGLVAAEYDEGPLPTFLPVLHTLSRIVLHVDADIRTVLQIKSVLAICKLEIQEKLRPTMELELHRWQRYVSHKHAKINQVVARVLKPKDTADFAQQFLSRGLDAGTQTEDENPDEATKETKSGASSAKRDRRKSKEKKRRHARSRGA
ncbi:uncharacterized protein AMSG_00217 [Thecamonas trahens ATCC 50062]|uniref:Uncharacterized protein n=1 Tax=Thecamonas trahens ATCC 50062 TaxID=461836 RepID=A0A0L0D1W2_THETB|nr:hypothetical protein AMSG_00217 [Thecamonas trahens ATCC 50062]KNC46100.1 hypothetical protein AMSG_00217 [Thecamonas trahens ATCC 50062]|eukprot:XP_013763078.1 hypothetical protein AMSG_00217 [Thecamonas trahens ATCC 50062]